MRTEQSSCFLAALVIQRWLLKSILPFTSLLDAVPITCCRRSGRDVGPKTIAEVLLAGHC